MSRRANRAVGGPGGARLGVASLGVASLGVAGDTEPYVFSAEALAHFAQVPGMGAQEKLNTDRTIRMTKGEAVPGLEQLSGNRWGSVQALWLMMSGYQAVSGTPTQTIQATGGIIRSLTGTNSLTPNGTMTWATRGIRYDGTISNRFATAAPVMPSATPWTVVDIGNSLGFATPYVAATRQQYFGCQNSGASQPGRIVGAMVNEFGKASSFYFNGTQSSFIESPGVICDSMPHAIAATFTAGGLHSLYLDGNDTVVASNSPTGGLSVIEQDVYRLGNFGGSYLSPIGTQNVHVVFSEALSAADLGKFVRNLNRIFNFGIAALGTTRIVEDHPNFIVGKAATPVNGGSNFYGTPDVVVDPTNAARLVAYHDVFGTGGLQAYGKVYRSADGGASWTLLADLPTTFWGKLIVKGTELYLLATSAEVNGNLIIRKSTDGGATWSAVTTLLTGSFHKSAVSYTIAGGYYLFALERLETATGAPGGVNQWRPRWTRMLRIPETGADFMVPGNWQSSNELDWATIGSTIVGGTPILGHETLEHCVVTMPDGSIRLFGRTLYMGPKASVFTYDVPTNTLAVVGSTTGMPFGYCKFVILRHTSGTYIAVGNLEQVAGQDDRTQLCIWTSTDAVTWTLKKTVCKLPAINFQEEAAQYPSACIRGNQLVIGARLSLSGSNRYHDAQFMGGWTVLLSEIGL